MEPLTLLNLCLAAIRSARADEVRKAIAYFDKYVPAWGYIDPETSHDYEHARGWNSALSDLRNTGIRDRLDSIAPGSACVEYRGGAHRR